MSLIKTNILALRSQNILQKNHTKLSTAIERLSSGMRVNSAKDDAAGQAIANRITSQYRGQNAAIRNANDGISMTATAEGALDEINERLQRIRELTVQGINGSYNQSDKDSIQAEINLNLKEIDRIVEQTHFNGITLLDGSTDLLGLQVGANDNNLLGVSFDSKGFGVDALGLKDYYISGIAGDIININTLSGDSVNIHLLDDSTTTNFFDIYNGNELSLNNAQFVRDPDSYGTNGFSVKALDENGDLIVYGATKTSAITTTKDRSSVVNVGVGLDFPRYQKAQYLGNNTINSNNFDYIAADNSSIDRAVSSVVRDNDGKFYIKTIEDGEEIFYKARIEIKEAAVDYQVSGSGVLGVYATATAIDDEKISTQTYSDADDIAAQSLSSFASIHWQDSNSDSFTDDSNLRLVKHNDTYYIEVMSEDDSVTPPTQSYNYYEASMEIDPVTNSLIIKAGDTASSIDHNDVTGEDSIPSIAVSTSHLPSDVNSLHKGDNDEKLYVQDGSGNYKSAEITKISINANGLIDHLELGKYGTSRSEADFSDSDITRYEEIEKIDINQLTSSDASIYIDGNSITRMYIHESLSNHSDHATDRFTQAQLNLKYDHYGNMEASIEELPSGNVQYLYEDVVVDGISVVDLNTPTPPNVTANYVDSSGKVYSNVLSKDEDGNYILKIGDSENSTYRTATLVEVNNLEDHLISQDGDLLIKTVNGSGEVIIYQAMRYDANTDAHEDQTTLIITETGQEIRLKQPRHPLSAMDQAISKIDEQRSHLGAIQNRLESTINQLTVSNQNLAAARSRIEDADYAVEVTNMTRAQILQQAGISVLAQANQQPQTVLSLLR